MTIDLTHLKTVEQRLLWLSHWMIHHANHVRSKVDGIKVGVHQASSASMVSIMTTLYRHHYIDASAIVEKVNGLTIGKRILQDGRPMTSEA